MKLNKPEYFFRPSQLIRRLRRYRRERGEKTLALPWGHSICVRLEENVGISIWQFGVYDLVASEALWRLTETGQHAVDIGANIGYMTSLLSARVGNQGKVTAFEPHPEIFKLLLRNVTLWGSTTNSPRPQLIQAAASDHDGNATLCIPMGFEANTGIAHLSGASGGHPESSLNVDVSTHRLDNSISSSGTQRLILKIDTEGNEYSVLRGAEELLLSRQIRDIVFEDHGRYPTPAMVFLKKCNYTLYRLRKSFLGPILEDPHYQEMGKIWEPPNYLATCEPNRAQLLFHSRGWQVLSSSATRPLLK